MTTSSSYCWCSLSCSRVFSLVEPLRWPPPLSRCWRFTSSPDPVPRRSQEDVIAFVAFLGSALFVGAAIGGGADRLTMARQREQEQRQLQELNAQIAEDATKMAVLQQVDQQRVALLRSVSHDLRTPLATIRAVATDLRDSNLHDEQTRQELLKSVSDEAERLDRLVGNLLSMSRIEAGSMRIEDQVVDLTELLQLTVIRLGPLFPQVEVEVHIDPALPLINGDPCCSTRSSPTCSRTQLDMRLSARRFSSISNRMMAPRSPCWSATTVQGSIRRWSIMSSRRSGGDPTATRVVSASRSCAQSSRRTVARFGLAASPGGGATFEVRLPAREDAML